MATKRAKSAKAQGKAKASTPAPSEAPSGADEKTLAFLRDTPMEIWTDPKGLVIQRSLGFNEQSARRRVHGLLRSESRFAANSLDDSGIILFGPVTGRIIVVHVRALCWRRYAGPPHSMIFSAMRSAGKW